MASSQPLSRSVGRRVGLNSIWILGARALSQLLLLVFSILIARSLGETGLGQYAFIASILFLGNVATTFGLDTMIIRELAHPAGRIGPGSGGLLTTALLIQLGLTALFIAVVWVLAVTLPNQTPETAAALRLASLSLLPLAFSTIYSAVLRAYERMDLYLVFNLVTALIMVGGAFAVLRPGGGLVAIAGVLVIAQTGGALAAGSMAHMALSDFHWRLSTPTTDFVRSVIGVGLVLALLMVAGVLYQRMAILVLSLTEGDAVTGWYSAAARLSEALKLLPAAFFGAIFPVMSRANAGGRLLSGTTPISAHPSSPGNPSETVEPAGAAHAVYERAFAYLVFGMIVLAIVSSALAGLIIPLLYGAGYEPAIAALRILVWGLPFTVIAVRLSFDLVSAGQDRAALLAMSVTLLLTLPLMITASNHWGLTGASAATVLAEALQVIVLLLVHRWYRHEAARHTR